MGPLSRLQVSVEAVVLMSSLAQVHGYVLSRIPVLRDKSDSEAVKRRARLLTLLSALLRLKTGKPSIWVSFGGGLLLLLLLSHQLWQPGRDDGHVQSGPCDIAQVWAQLHAGCDIWVGAHQFTA